MMKFLCLLSLPKFYHPLFLATHNPLFGEKKRQRNHLFRESRSSSGRQPWGAPGTGADPAGAGGPSHTGAGCPYWVLGADGECPYWVHGTGAGCTSWILLQCAHAGCWRRVPVLGVWYWCWVRVVDPAAGFRCCVPVEGAGTGCIVLVLAAGARCQCREHGAGTGCVVLVLGAGAGCWCCVCGAGTGYLVLGAWCWYWVPVQGASTGCVVLVLGAAARCWYWGHGAG